MSEAKNEVQPRSGDLERVVRCQWFGCDEEATIRIPRASCNVCDEHYLLNVLRFGADLKGVPLKAPNA